MFVLNATMPPSLPILERFSSFTRLTRVTAWLFRFVNNCRKTGGRKLGPLLVDELLHAERYWITVVQRSAFLEEVSCLKKHRQLPSSSHLLSLHPVLDAHGLLHVGGRSEHSSLSYSRRHPVILPGSHAVTTPYSNKAPVSFARWSYPSHCHAESPFPHSGSSKSYPNNYTFMHCLPLCFSQT